MLKLRKIVFIVLLGVVNHLTAQQNTVPQQPDSVKIQVDSTLILQSDSVKIEAEKVILPQVSDSAALASVQKIIEKKTFKPSPKKAVIYSAIFPGLGQIYNRKYWKLPIVYGGFVGFSYAITWNNGHYQDYFWGHHDILDDDPTTNRWHALVPYQYRENPESIDKQWFSGVLKDRKNYFRYYRDLSIILTVLWYGLGIVDAYVDAQLFEFDVSPDLSMRLEPVILKKSDMNYLANSNSYGLKFSFSF